MTKAIKVQMSAAVTANEINTFVIGETNEISLKFQIIIGMVRHVAESVSIKGERIEIIKFDFFKCSFK